MKKLRFVVPALVAFALPFPFPFALRQAFAAENAQTFVEARQGQLTSALRSAPGEGRDKKVGAILDGMIDYEELARRSMGSHWGDIDDGEHKRFVTLLRRLVARTYQRNVQSVLDYDVRFEGEESAPEGYVVHTRARPKKDQLEEPLAIDYRLLREKDGWRVFDIVTDGSSMVVSYRNQFHRIIQKDGYPKLVERMQQRLDKGDTGGSTAVN